MTRNLAGAEEQATAGAAPYRAVLFDFDDTLVKTWKVKWAQHKAAALKFYSIKLTDEELNQHWGKPFNELIGHLCHHADSIERMIAAYRTLEAQFPKEAQPDAHQAISTLKLGSFVLGIVSSMNRSYIGQDLPRLGFNASDFVVIQGAEATPVNKPRPEVFVPALGVLAARGIQPQQTMYVGDALIDYYASRDAGLGFAGVTTGRNTALEFQRAGATHVIGGLVELPRLLRPVADYTGYHDTQL